MRQGQNFRQLARNMTRKLPGRPEPKRDAHPGAAPAYAPMPVRRPSPYGPRITPTYLRLR